ncbi:MAG: RidA family protein [Candidatus Baltobacteraceae bacterium]
MKREFLSFERPGRSNLPFSDAVRAGATYYIAGRIGLDDATNLPPADAAEEARLLMDDLREVLEKCGLRMRDLVQVTVYTPDVSLYETFNGVYRTYFTGPLPARAFLGSGPLLFGARFELTAIAAA